jgi:hypothetical protein
MINQIIKTTSPVELTDNAVHLPSGTKGGKVADFVQTGETVYVWAGEGDIDSRPELVDAILVASTGYDGSYISADLAEYELLRPLGNNADGTATTDLQYANFAGHAPRELEPGRLYPIANEPFDLEFRHKWFNFGAGHPATGWGWRCELHGSAETSDPTGHAIYHYSDPEWTQFAGTTGAFSQGPSEWQTDADGNPLTVYYCVSWDGDMRAEKADWYFAVQESVVLRGKSQLYANEDSCRYLFWDRIQGQEPDPGAVWTDTGVTVSVVGAGIYSTSETVPDLSVGETIRLDDQETDFIGYWPVAGTPSSTIQINPHVTVPAGSALWRLL